MILFLYYLRLKSTLINVFFTYCSGIDGKRWCPDCVEAHEVLDEIFANAPASIYIIVAELTRKEWKETPGKDHFLRKDGFGVQSIPTFMKWNSKEMKPDKFVLRDGECCQMERISTVLNESVST